MARVEWVRQRLENWARWHAQRDSGALGYPSQSAFTRLGVQVGTRESIIPVDSLDARQIDDAVRSLQLRRSHLYLVLSLHYAQALPIHLVARRMARAVSTVKRNLEDADHAIAQWLDEQRDKRADR